MKQWWAFYTKKITIAKNNQGQIQDCDKLLIPLII